jgi:serine/threonine protein kinase
MKQIGKYRIRGLLGRGGMGRVYKVELPVVGKIVALKALRPDPLLIRLMGEEAIRHLFIEEAITLGRLRHPNIVALLDYDTMGERPYYTMEYYAHNLGDMLGESFQVELASRPLDPDRALDYTTQILRGLACLHHAGIVHRDVKPFNVLITEYERIKICDFGLSKLHGEEGYGGPSNLNVGSPFYAAPEQERDPDSAGPPADLFAVGVMLYRMLTGHLPPEGGDPAPPVGRFNPDLDAPWDGVIALATAATPTKRFQTAGQMLAALADLKQHWEDQKARNCALPTDREETRISQAPSPRSEPGKWADLRAIPLKVRADAAKAVFGLDDLWRPGTYLAPQLSADGQDRVVDTDHGLVWQRSGSLYPLDWPAARKAVAALNQSGFAGRTDWRLPTMAELLTLVLPPAQGRRFCQAPIFNPRQKWLWSADTKSFQAAWQVNLELGYAGWTDKSSRLYFRAVCGLRRSL